MGPKCVRKPKSAFEFYKLSDVRERRSYAKHKRVVIRATLEFNYRQELKCTSEFMGGKFD